VPSRSVVVIRCAVRAIGVLAATVIGAWSARLAAAGACPGERFWFPQPTLEAKSAAAPTTAAW
jgi:hypothetical protein